MADRDWLFSYAAEQNAKRAAANAADATAAATAATIAANNAASTNKMADILLMEMVSEMREWQRSRFNDIIGSLDRRAEQIQNLESMVKNLQEQVAGLQSRLYKEGK